jgi:hypothetical protein
MGPFVCMYAYIYSSFFTNLEEQFNNLSQITLKIVVCGSFYNFLSLKFLEQRLSMT